MRSLYRALVPAETRLWLYKLRHPEEFQALRTQVNPSPKGDFSLRNCDRYHAVFVHITKSAGTSVAKGLFGELPYHYTATEYRVIFGRKTFNEYFKFAFVRNPWDRLYSAYSFLKDGGWDENDRAWAEKNLAQVPDFSTFVNEWLTRDRLDSHIHFWPQHKFICSAGGRGLIDYLGYFETLEKDFNYIAERIGVQARLQHVNASTRSDYRSVYDARTIAKVATLYQEDIAMLGYRFDGFTRRKIENGRFVPA